MSTKKLLQSLIPIICGVLMVLLILASVAKQAEKVSASEENSVRYVSNDGTDNANDCSISSQPCRTVQHAIYTAIDGDEIHVSAGYYTGTMSFPSDLVTATIIITKNLSVLSGGFSADFSISRSRYLSNNNRCSRKRALFCAIHFEYKYNSRWFYSYRRSAILFW